MLKRVLYYRLEDITAGTVGPKLRQMGQNLFKFGVTQQEDIAHADKLVPSLRCIPISKSRFPKLLSASWVAPNATIIGDVLLGEGTSIWHGVIIRGDQAKVNIGTNTVIQDKAQIMNSLKDGSLVTIGNEAYIGPNTHLDGCTIEDYAYIGMGASVHQGATVESYAFVAAGAVVESGQTVPSGQVWAGNPACYLRDLSQTEKHQIYEYMQEMQQLADIYCEETEKTNREILDHYDQSMKYWYQDPMERVIDKINSIGIPTSHEDMEHIEQRIYTDYASAVDFDVEDPAHRKDAANRGTQPYEQDLSKYPEIFKVYSENYQRYENTKTKFEEEDLKSQKTPKAIRRRIPKDQSPWEKRTDDIIPRFTGTSMQ